MRFSVIIPTYNRATLVAATVKSALSLPYDNFEVIVVDDGSTDETPDFFRTFRDPRVIYYRKEQGERGAARNFGAARATGDYLNFFDSDDSLIPGHLMEAKKCVEANRRPEVFALGFRIENAKGKVIRVIDNLPEPMNMEFLRGNPLGCNPVFVRRDIFQATPFREDKGLAGSEDILLWLQLSSRYPFHFWPKVTSVHLDHASRSVYGQNEASLEERNRLLIHYLEQDPVFLKTFGSHLSDIRAQRHIYTAVHLAVSGYHFAPFKYLFMAGFTRFSSLFQAGALGALKQVFLGFFRSRYRPD